MSNTNRARNGFEANVRRHTTLGVGLVVGLAYSNLDLNDVIAGDAEIAFLVILMSLTYLAGVFVGTRKYR